MKILKTLLPIAILILFIPTLSACWDMREINEIGLVVAVGIDKADGPNKYLITVQVANESGQNSTESKGSSQNEIWVGTAEGDSLFDATRELSGISSRRIMWAHNNVIIIGESLAREGITPVVDFFTHNPELRMKTAVVVSKGEARPYLAAKVGMESPPGVSYILMEGYRAIRAESVESHMLQVSASLRGKYSNPFISVISFTNAISQSSQSHTEESSNTIELAGAAVFKRDKLVGFLSPGESRGAAWILNQTQDTVVAVADPDHENKSVSVETYGVKSKIESRVVNGIPQVQIYLKGLGRITEEDASTYLDINEDKKHVSELVDKTIRDEIEKSLAVIQKTYESDVLDFASIVHSQNDAEWEVGLKERWDQVFPKIPVTVSVDIEIKTSTLNQEPINIY